MSFVWREKGFLKSFPNTTFREYNMKMFIEGILKIPMYDVF